MSYSMSLLTERQKEELHKAMLSYLYNSGMHATFDALKIESNNTDIQMDEPGAATRYHGLLEKKWTSVIRLQKKIMDLEARNAALQSELALPGRSSSTTASNNPDWIPRPPHRHTLPGHRGPISKVTFHPVWNVLASASEDASIKIWDWEAGECERTLKGHTKAVMDVDFDPKGDLLVSCSNDMSIKIWDTQNSYKNTKTLQGHDHSVSSVRFLPPQGDFIVSASRDKTVRIWEVATGYCVKTLWGHEQWVRSVSPSEDGKLLVTASSDLTSIIFDRTTGEEKLQLRGHENVVEAAEFAPVASYAVLRQMTGIRASATDERAKQPGCFIATGSRDKTIRLWDGLTGQCVKILTGHDNWIRALAFHPNGKYLLSASDDKTIRVWDLSLGKLWKTIDAHDHFVSCLTWGRTTTGATTSTGANGMTAGQEVKRRVSVLATGSVDQTIKVWLP
ncbi:hypothetical protein NliqN6_2495 [Naganishia liquefaciens]|uniref:Nuclear distribution protein PAC1 n=1 Tax=Naganishia liquefaciens TaxID=104408 RepID=A0A8H3YEB6_9TREE|nr:hypothetical protein NliqN6_2495 [Naganishia liquefaciens]